MSDSLGKIGQTVSTPLGSFVQSAKQGLTDLSQIVFSDNRKFQYFGLGVAQLKGRDMMKMHSLFVASAGLLVAGIGIFMSIAHPGAAGYAMAAVGGALIVFGLREAVIQSVAREKEKKKLEKGCGHPIEEDESTTYSFKEFVSDSVKAFARVTMFQPRYK